ncbi:PREDICTED: mucin-5B-like isoform X1 [Branchiostoma belcheri]|uniref:Mucin-5B-like isoform X1 n=1 Tax=Branchiostoma belcheri TaxID=7741 RepID=A0A6P5AYT4_BRABE|nr:PREDICTED: mucin-5B-like isoform X1 [Branchiostoma belcheri]
MSTTSQATTMHGTTASMNTTAPMQGTTAAMNTTATMQGTTGGANTAAMPGTTSRMNTTATMPDTTGAMNTTARMPGTTGAMNTTATMPGSAGAMNTTATMPGTTGAMNTTATMPGTTGAMNSTAAMSGTTGGISSTAMPGTTSTMNTTATMPGTTGAMNTTVTMPGTSDRMNSTAAMQGTTAATNTTAAIQGTTGAMNTTAAMQGSTDTMNTTAGTSLTTGTPETTVSTASDNTTMAPMNTTMASTNTTMMATTQTTTMMTTTTPGPWRVTFDGDCKIALDYEADFLQNCSVAVATWLNISKTATRCYDLRCGSTIVTVEVNRSASEGVADKFNSLMNNANESLMIVFQGANFTATDARVISEPTQPTTADGSTIPSTTDANTTASFCMIRGLDYTGCVIFLSCVIAVGVILLALVLWAIIHCCRRQKSKSFDLLSDIPHISLSDYPMTTIPRPSVYQHGNSSGQVNMAYITDQDDIDKPKQPLESSNTSQSSHSSGRVEDGKNTSMQPDGSSNHVQQEAASASYQAVPTEEQPPPVYSPQSGTNNVVQPTGTDQAPGPYPSLASPVNEALLDIPETVDNPEVPESENPTISFRAPDAQDTPESATPGSPKVIKGDDGSVSVVVNW